MRGWKRIHSGSKVGWDIYIIPKQYTDLKVAYFFNLAVKMKMHLDALQEEKIDCQSLLDFLDYFPQNVKLIFIKEMNFVPRPLHASRQSAKVKTYEFEEFWIPNI